MWTLHWFLEFVCWSLVLRLLVWCFMGLYLWLLVCVIHLLAGWLRYAGCLLLIDFVDSACYLDVWFYVIFCAGWCLIDCGVVVLRAGSCFLCRCFDCCSLLLFVFCCFVVECLLMLDALIWCVIYSCYWLFWFLRVGVWVLAVYCDVAYSCFGLCFVAAFIVCFLLFGCLCWLGCFTLFVFWVVLFLLGLCLQLAIFCLLCVVEWGGFTVTWFLCI